MFELSKLTVDYGQVRPLDGVTATLGPEPVALMGPSGSGKSSLLRVLAGQQRQTSGAVALNGIEVQRASWTSAGDRRVALIHQDYRLVEFLTVADNLLLAAEIHGLAKHPDDAESVLATVGLGEVGGSRLPHTLSGGEQQRVAIARALMCEAEALLADEPTGALDADTTHEVIDLLVDVARRESVVLLVGTHDPTVAARMDARFDLAQGRLRSAA